jgi:voltage-gated potassium channel
MKNIDQPTGRDGGDDPAVDDPSGRLTAYMIRSQTPLDLLALATLWITVVPISDLGSSPAARAVALTIRIGISAVYGVDMAIRSLLARRHVHYLLAHPLGCASVIFPPLRVLFSLRLVRSMFRRGNLTRFLLAASVLVLNGAVIVYLVEQHAPGSNIHTLGDSLWWSVVTVTTVGYGDYVPVTIPGRITACFIMGIGLLTLAVVTAQVASSFIAQRPSRAERSPQAEPVPLEALAELDRRLARIEQLLTAAAEPAPRRAAGPPGQEPSSGRP